MSEITALDIAQIKYLGISEKILNEQITLLKNATLLINLTSAAGIGSGILKLDDKEVGYYQEHFDQRIQVTKITRFVPASGAASRMFQSFFQFLENGIENEEIKVYARNFSAFAFYNKIKCRNEPDYSCAINNMIKVLKLAELPKALIPFHAYKTGSRTALEEHLVECAILQGPGGTINIHFTISPDHQDKINKLIEEKLDRLKSGYKCDFEITFSYQQQNTDTIAINPDGQIFRDNNGKIVFRPGGHGALLSNLNNLDADLIYIKNIDNIQPDYAKVKTVLYKKALGGYLLALQQRIASYLLKLDEGKIDIGQVEEFISTELLIKIPDSYYPMSPELKLSFLYSKLNRPIRICGMVRNEGEPGGGPFWIGNKYGEESLQIIESSQIDFNNKMQDDIFHHSSHFNPVDIVCWIRDYKGDKFDLCKFTDPDSAIITEKSQGGQAIKVLEHPGLWNGAMANWITIFIEVPINTFSPVKTITDLLRPQHQPA